MSVQTHWYSCKNNSQITGFSKVVLKKGGYKPWTRLWKLLNPLNKEQVTVLYVWFVLASPGRVVKDVKTSSQSRNSLNLSWKKRGFPLWWCIKPKERGSLDKLRQVFYERMLTYAYFRQKSSLKLFYHCVFTNIPSMWSYFIDLACWSFWSFSNND